MIYKYKYSNIVSNVECFAVKLQQSWLKGKVQCSFEFPVKKVSEDEAHDALYSSWYREKQFKVYCMFADFCESPELMNKLWQTVVCMSEDVLQRAVSLFPSSSHILSVCMSALFIMVDSRLWWIQGNMPSIFFLEITRFPFFQTSVTVVVMHFTLTCPFQTIITSSYS